MEPSTASVTPDADVVDIIDLTMEEPSTSSVMPDADVDIIDLTMEPSTSSVTLDADMLDIIEETLIEMEESREFTPMPGMINAFFHNLPLEVTQEKFDAYIRSHGVPVYNTYVRKKKRNVAYLDVATLEHFKLLREKIKNVELCGEKVPIMLNPSIGASKQQEYKTKLKNMAQAERDDALEMRLGKIKVHVGNIPGDTDPKKLHEYLTNLEVKVYMSSCKLYRQRDLMEKDGGLRFVASDFKYGFIGLESVEDLKILKSCDRVFNGQKLSFTLKKTKRSREVQNEMEEHLSKKQKVVDGFSQFHPQLVKKLGLETMKASYEQELDLKLNLRLKCDQLPPGTKTDHFLFCMLCEENGHCRKAQCPKYNDKQWPTFRDSILMFGEFVDIYGIHSSTVYEQVNQLCLRNCHVVICDRKMFNLICYICDMKFENRDEYDTHMQGEAHSEETMSMGNPKRIPNLTRLSQLPSVFEENDCGDYLFLCSVCAHVVPGPASKHFEEKRHQYKLIHSPRCVTCSLFLVNRVPKYADNNLKKHAYGDLHKRMKKLKNVEDENETQKMKEEKGVKNNVEGGNGMKEEELNEGLKNGKKCGDEGMLEKDETQKLREEEGVKNDIEGGNKIVEEGEEMNEGLKNGKKCDDEEMQEKDGTDEEKSAIKIVEEKDEVEKSKE